MMESNDMEHGDKRAETLPGMEGVMNPLDEAYLRSEEARKIFETAEEAAPWLEDYWALLAEGWPWRQAVYLVWASQPKQARKPKTQRELATEVLGLTSDRVIRKWRDRNPAIVARIARLVASTLSNARAEIYQALIQAASKPDPRAHSDRRLALEMLGDYMPRQRVDVGPALPDDWSEMDTKDLRAMVQGNVGKGEE